MSYIKIMKLKRRRTHEEMANGHLVRGQAHCIVGYRFPNNTTYECSICKSHFKAYKKLKLHKQDAHAYD